MKRNWLAMLALLWLPLGAPAWAEAEEDSFEVPEGFEVTMLEPLGGRVARPVTWFYREAHDAASFKWVLSRENPEDGPYQTGVRIQLIAAVKAKTGQDGKAFIEEFLAGRRSSAEVLHECEVEDQGVLTRSCIQTRELIPSADADEPFQIQYTVFWGNQVDVALFVTAGTLASQWDEFAPIFAEIEKFELIDLDRFDASGQMTEPKQSGESEGSADGVDEQGPADADSSDDSKAADAIKADGSE
jgi:hypothetical protein